MNVWQPEKKNYFGVIQESREIFLLEINEKFKSICVLRDFPASSWNLDVNYRIKDSKIYFRFKYIIEILKISYERNSIIMWVECSNSVVFTLSVDSPNQSCQIEFLNQ